MSELWILMLISVSLMWIYENGYIRTLDRSLTNQRISVIFVSLTILLGGYLGLRTNYNDTMAYIGGYEQTKKIPEFWQTYDISLSKDPGFNLVNGILKTLGVSTQNWLMIYALITIGLYLAYIRKNGNDYILNIFLFFGVGSYAFAGAAIKQSIATAISLYALQYALDRKWLKYIALIFIAMTFHVYAVIFLCVPFLVFKPGTKKTVILIVATVVIAFSLKSLFGTITMLTANIGESYNVASFSGEGVNIFRILVCNVPLVLMILFYNEIFMESSEKDNLMFNLSMMNGCIMFIGLFGTANYFARLANYFVATQAITLPWMINNISERSRKILKIGMIIGYCGYFYYSNNIVYGAFNNMNRISVYEYIKQLF